MASTLLSPLHRANRQILIAMGERLTAAGIDLPVDDGHALLYLSRYGPCPTGNVQRVIGCQRSTLTSLLDRLERRDLIERSHDETDRRVILVEATSAGDRLADRLETIGLALEAELAAALGPRDRATLSRFFAAVDRATGVTVVDHTRRPPRS